MIAFLTVEQVIALHDAEERCPLIDRGKLESAVGQCRTTWGGEYLYPTLVQQAAALLFCVGNAHAFENANKRAAWLACAAFLDLNGVELIDVPQAEIVQFMEDVVTGVLQIPDIASWITERI